MDRKDLKIQALLEKIRDLTVVNENEKADYRVTITLLENERDELKAKVQELEGSDVPDVAEQLDDDEDVA